jgi:hypothetical protein
LDLLTAQGTLRMYRSLEGKYYRRMETVYKQLPKPPDLSDPDWDGWLVAMRRWYHQFYHTPDPTLI